MWTPQGLGSPREVDTPDSGREGSLGPGQTPSPRGKVGTLWAPALAQIPSAGAYGCLGEPGAEWTSPFPVELSRCPLPLCFSDHYRSGPWGWCCASGSWPGSRERRCGGNGPILGGPCIPGIRPAGPSLVFWSLLCLQIVRLMSLPVRLSFGVWEIRSFWKPQGLPV